MIYKSKDTKFRNINNTLIFDRVGNVEHNEFFELDKNDEFSHKHFNLSEAFRDYVNEIDQYIVGLQRLTKSRWDYELVFQITIDYEWAEVSWIYTPKNVTIEMDEQVECKLIHQNGASNSGYIEADSTRYLEDMLDEIACSITPQIIHEEQCDDYEKYQIARDLAEEKWYECKYLSIFEENLPYSNYVDLRVYRLTNKDIDYEDDWFWQSVDNAYRDLQNAVIDFVKEKHLEVCILSRKRKDIIVVPKISNRGYKDSIYEIALTTQEELDEVADFIQKTAKELIAEIA